MSNSFFRFKKFIIHQDKCAMKVTTDACLFGAWVAAVLENLDSEIENGGLVDKRKKQVESVLDIGCGTGLLSLMLAQKFNAKIDAVEIDGETASQALENEMACSFKNSIKIIHADIRDFSFEKKYDVIISNPPFYENELKSFSAKKNTAYHSADLSIEDLLGVIKTNLTGAGVFFLLLPFKRFDEIRNLFRENELIPAQITFIRQTVNHDYSRIMLMGKINDGEGSEIQFDEISIKDEREQYMEEFTELLKDYYLYL